MAAAVCRPELRLEDLTAPLEPEVDPLLCAGPKLEPCLRDGKSSAALTALGRCTRFSYKFLESAWPVSERIADLPLLTFAA